MPARLEIGAGERFGRLTIIKEAEPVPRAPYRGHWRMFLARCDCGGEIVTRLNSLRSGRVNSCGCLIAETSPANAKIVHGYARGQRIPEYHAWLSMIHRCENPNLRGWKYWGGRGIRVCAKWRHDFKAFLADVGFRPSHLHSIDRIDNDGHYEPGNVRWATKSEQAFNRRPKGAATLGMSA